MKKGNILVIVLIIVIVILITVFATLYFTGIISFNSKTSADQKETLTPVTVADGPKFEEVSIEENTEDLDRMIKILSFSNYVSTQTDEYGNFPGFYFLGFTGDRITTLSNDAVQSIAYKYWANTNNGNLTEFIDVDENVAWFPKKLMEESIEKVFGKVVKETYSPSDFSYLGSKEIKYNAEKEAYRMPLGVGGRFPQIILATYKLEKSEAEYVVYQKAIYMDYEYDDKTSIDYTIVYLKNGEKEKLKTEELRSLEEKELDAYVIKYYEESRDKVIMSNFYDRASEFKHTFRKDENGNYIWKSSEKIK